MKSSISRKLNLSLLASASIVAMVAAPCYAQGVEKSFNIPAGSAKITIRQFAAQSGMQVLANGADLDGVTTNAVIGSFTPEDALSRLLNGSVLTVRVNANGTVLIVNAKTAPPQDAVKTDASQVVVVVTGFKRSYADALKAKRSNVGITDGISSDGLGRFPDLNVGEALQRVPGVQINREADSRNATVNLRGLPGTYARVTLNGVAFADPILDDSTPLGAFNSDIFSAITIIKSPSASDQPGGLSGNIDLQIQPALSRKDGGFAKVSAEYDDLGKYTSPGFTLGYNKHLGRDLAVYGTLAYSKEKFRRDSIFFNQYTKLNATNTPNYATKYASAYPNGVFAPTDMRQSVKYNTGDLLSAAAGVEYKSSESLKYSLDGFFTQRKLEAYTDILDVDLRNANTVIDPTGGVFTLADGNAYINKFNYSNANVYDSFRREPVTQRTWGVNAKTEWRTDAWRVSNTLTVSSAENHLYQTQLDVRNTATATGNGTSGSFYSGGGNIGDYSFTMSPNPAVAIPTGTTWTPATSGPSINGTNGYVLIVAGSEGFARNDLSAWQTDVEHYFNGGLFTSVQAGVRLEHDKFTSRGYRTSAVGVNLSNVTNAFVKTSDFASNFFGGNGGNYLSNWQTVDFDYAVSKLKPVTVGTGQTLTATGWINDPTNGSFLSNNFSNANAIISSYVMGKFSHDVLGVPVRGNAGVRYEDTRNTIISMDKNAAGDFVNNTYKHNYGNLLPSAMFAADLSDTVVLRGAAYSTFVRPQPRQASPTTQVSGSLSTGYSVTLGNADLKPYKANSFDLSLEWYNRANGIVAFDIFEKDITGIIAAVTDKSLICPSDASAWGLGTLTWNGTACTSNLTSNGNPVTVAVSGNFNNPNTIKVKGVEFNVQQNLDFLPAPWDKLGGAFNYSYTTISGKYPNGTQAILPGVSKNNVNLIGYYETKDYGVRIVYNYRDKYDLAAGGTFSGAARSVKARGQIDASASYNVNARISLSFDAFNLGNAKRVEYQNEELMPRRVDYDGRTYQFSVRASF